MPYNDRQDEVNDEENKENKKNKFDGTKYIKEAYISKYNNKCDNHVNLLMFTDGTTNWHYLAIKNIPGLLRGITSNHNGEFYCLNCFHSYRTKGKLKKHERICYDNKFYFLKMPDDDNILISKPGKKSLEHALNMCADLECLLLKINTCDNNPSTSYTIAKVLHKPSGYSLVTCCSFDKSENKQTYYRGKNFMKKFCGDLKEHVNRIINFEMKPMTPLTDEEKESYKNHQLCHICEK